MWAYRQLAPLWVALRQAVPDVVLDPTWSLRVDAWNVRNLDFRLYRRVIEIRDGALAMRPHFDPTVEELARLSAMQAHIPQSEIDPTVEATQIAVALEAHREGRFPSHHAWRPPVLQNGSDLDAEVKALVPVAIAFATSTVVKSVVADFQRRYASPIPHRQARQYDV
jgi:hypothetical protein